MTAPVGWCAAPACRQMRPLAELVAWWPVADPARVQHVCRPGLDRPGRLTGACFRTVPSGPAYAVALATEASHHIPADHGGQRAAVAPINGQQSTGSNRP